MSKMLAASGAILVAAPAAAHVVDINYLAPAIRVALEAEIMECVR